MYVEPAPFVIALDGPAASGKSTVGLGAAGELGFFYFDTGVLYRALTAVALERGIDPADGAALARAVAEVDFHVQPASVEDGRQVDIFAGGLDISHRVRTPEVDRQVSAVAAHAEVREALMDPQRAAARAPGTILAGRDIGTVIVPDAPLKLWITASVEERARRRAAQTGQAYAEVLKAMATRDHIDGNRAIAPMVRAADSVELDTDGLSPEAVIARIVSLARERMATWPHPSPSLA